ncbi:hypothetical protein WDW37_21060 [Bdellovibrionota bacterium FG-1]
MKYNTTKYCIDRIRLEKLKQKTWILAILAKSLFLLVDWIAETLR